MGRRRDKGFSAETGLFAAFFAATAVADITPCHAIALRQLTRELTLERSAP